MLFSEWDKTCTKPLTTFLTCSATILHKVSSGIFGTAAYDLPAEPQPNLVAVQSVAQKSKVSKEKKEKKEKKVVVTVQNKAAKVAQVVKKTDSKKRSNKKA
jgi:hypothetical protein